MRLKLALLALALLLALPAAAQNRQSVPRLEATQEFRPPSVNECPDDLSNQRVGDLCWDKDDTRLYVCSAATSSACTTWIAISSASNASGSADPDECDVGDTFVNTTTSTFKVCTAADTWSAFFTEDTPLTGDLGGDLAASTVVGAQAGALNSYVIVGDVGGTIDATTVDSVQADSVALTTDTTGNYVDNTTDTSLVLTGTEGATLGVNAAGTFYDLVTWGSDDSVTDHTPYWKFDGEAASAADPALCPDQNGTGLQVTNSGLTAISFTVGDIGENQDGNLFIGTGSGDGLLRINNGGTLKYSSITSEADGTRNVVLPDVAGAIPIVPTTGSIGALQIVDYSAYATGTLACAGVGLTCVVAVDPEDGVSVACSTDMNVGGYTVTGVAEVFYVFCN